MGLWFGLPTKPPCSQQPVLREPSKRLEPGSLTTCREVVRLHPVSQDKRCACSDWSSEHLTCGPAETSWGADCKFQKSAELRLCIEQSQSTRTLPDSGAFDATGCCWPPNPRTRPTVSGDNNTPAVIIQSSLSFNRSSSSSPPCSSCCGVAVPVDCCCFFDLRPLSLPSFLQWF